MVVRGTMNLMRVLNATTSSNMCGSGMGNNTAVGTKRDYHKNVVDHYENPRNVGSFDKNDVNVGTGLVGAPACGDVMKLQIKVDDKGEIVDSCFKTFGCGSAIASSSVATEWYGHMMMMTRHSVHELAPDTDTHTHTHTHTHRNKERQQLTWKYVLYAHMCVPLCVYMFAYVYVQIQGEREEREHGDRYQE